MRIRKILFGKFCVEKKIEKNIYRAVYSFFHCKMKAFLLDFARKHENLPIDGQL